MSLIVPLSSIPNQTLNIVLNSQNCTIDLLTRNDYVFMNLFLNNVNIIYGRKLTMYTPVIPYLYIQSKFNGNFVFINNDGNVFTEPNYNFFSTSQSLVYYTSTDING